MSDILRKTDEELSVLIASSNPEAISVLIDRYQSPLSRYLKRMGFHKDDDVQDLLQNVFIKVYVNINSFDKNLSFSSWVYRITHNEAVSFLRKHKSRPEGNLIDDGEEILLGLEESLDIEKEIDRDINSKHLMRVLNNLEQKYRDVLILKYFEDKDYESISDILEVPKGSVATLLHRAKKKIKMQLKHLWNTK